MNATNLKSRAPLKISYKKDTSGLLLIIEGKQSMSPFLELSSCKLCTEKSASKLKTLEAYKFKCVLELLPNWIYLQNNKCSEEPEKNSRPRWYLKKSSLITRPASESKNECFFLIAPAPL